jgi:hypothetical protein
MMSQIYTRVLSIIILAACTGANTAAAIIFYALHLRSPDSISMGAVTPFLLMAAFCAYFVVLNFSLLRGLLTQAGVKGPPNLGEYVEKKEDIEEDAGPCPPHNWKENPHNKKLMCTKCRRRADLGL